MGLPFPCTISRGRSRNSARRSCALGKSQLGCHTGNRDPKSHPGLAGTPTQLTQRRCEHAHRVQDKISSTPPTSTTRPPPQLPPARWQPPGAQTPPPSLPSPTHSFFLLNTNTHGRTLPILEELLPLFPFLGAQSTSPGHSSGAGKASPQSLEVLSAPGVGAPEQEAQDAQLHLPCFKKSFNCCYLSQIQASLMQKPKVQHCSTPYRSPDGALQEGTAGAHSPHPLFP